MKVCPRCKTEKPLAEFYKDRTKPGGLMSHCKICVDTRRRQWALKNKEKSYATYRRRIDNSDPEELRQKRREAQARYKEKYPDRTRQSSLKWHRNNPQLSRDNTRRWREGNPEKNALKSRRWREENREKAREVISRWRQNNLDKAKEFSRNSTRQRRARRIGSGGKVTAKEWQLLLDYYGNICLCCGASGQDIPLTQDHIRPLSKGGAHSIENLQPLCRSCNSTKGVKTIDYRSSTLERYQQLALL